MTSLIAVILISPKLAPIHLAVPRARLVLPGLFWCADCCYAIFNRAVGVIIKNLGAVAGCESRVGVPCGGCARSEVGESYVITNGEIEIADFE